MRRRRHRRLTVPLIALFLVAHAICVCAAPAAVPSDRVTASAADPHACCHPHDAAPAQHEPAPRCLHCTHTVLAAPDTMRSAVPTLVVTPLADLTAFPSPALALVAHTPAFDGRDFSRPLSSRTSVLRL